MWHVDSFQKMLGNTPKKRCSTVLFYTILNTITAVVVAPWRTSAFLSSRRAAAVVAAAPVVKDVESRLTYRPFIPWMIWFIPTPCAYMFKQIQPAILPYSRLIGIWRSSFKSSAYFVFMFIILTTNSYKLATESWTNFAMAHPLGPLPELGPSQSPLGQSWAPNGWNNATRWWWRNSKRWHLKRKDISLLDLKEPPTYGNSKKFQWQCSCTVLSPSLCPVKEQRKATPLGVKSPGQNVAMRDTWRGSRMHALHLEPQQVAGSYNISHGSACCKLLFLWLLLSFSLFFVGLAYGNHLLIYFQVNIKCKTFLKDFVKLPHL